MANQRARETINELFRWLDMRKKEKKKAGIKRGQAPAPFTTKDGTTIPFIASDKAKEYLQMRQELKEQGFLPY